MTRTTAWFLLLALAAVAEDAQQTLEDRLLFFVNAENSLRVADMLDAGADPNQAWTDGKSPESALMLAIENLSLIHI